MQKGYSMGIQTFPLKDGSDYVPPATLLEALESAYGFQNVYFQLPAAYVWLLANPKKRKTRKGMPRFLNAWMARSKPDVRTKASVGMYCGPTMTDAEAESIRQRLKQNSLKAV